jgi:hypothetical protein
MSERTEDWVEKEARRIYDVVDGVATTPSHDVEMIAKALRAAEARGISAMRDALTEQCKYSTTLHVGALQIVLTAKELTARPAAPQAQPSLNKENAGE